MHESLDENENKRIAWTLLLSCGVGKKKIDDDFEVKITVWFL